VTELHTPTLGEFVDVDEPGADAVLGEDGETAVIPEGGDAMFYGDGGAGKTTLAVDLACHLAAGDEWLGIPVARPLRVLVIENEGPRPHFRAKLRRKRAAWQGSTIGDRIRVLEEPWAIVTLANEEHRAALAAKLHEFEVDVVVLGPVTAAGMLEAGTIQQVREFKARVDDVRLRAGRTVAFVLVHHEAKSGLVSGAWEGVGDTLMHVQGQGHGHTRLFIQKARWSSAHHATSLQLAWTEDEGFEVEDKPELDDEAIADLILNVVRASGGASWNMIDEKTSGAKATRKRAIRDRLLAGGRLIDTGGKAGMQLWHVDDPARPAVQVELSPNGDAPGTHLGMVRP